MITLDARLMGAFRDSRVSRFAAQLRPNMIAGMDDAAEILLNEIKINLSKGGTVPRKAAGKRQPPNETDHLRVITGYLRSSWRKYRSVLTGLNEVMAQVFTTAKYALTHEKGDPSRNIRKRATVAPALKDKHDEMLLAFVRQVRKPLL
jgi:hypothetical protein